MRAYKNKAAADKEAACRAVADQEAAKKAAADKKAATVAEKAAVAKKATSDKQEGRCQKKCKQVAEEKQAVEEKKTAKQASSPNTQNENSLDRYSKVGILMSSPRGSFSSGQDPSFSPAASDDTCDHAGGTRQANAFDVIEYLILTSTVFMMHQNKGHGRCYTNDGLTLIAFL